MAVVAAILGLLLVLVLFFFRNSECSCLGRVEKKWPNPQANLNQ